ncbi:MAG: M48 family metallopeptidase [Persicimonas sp.]
MKNFFEHQDTARRNTFRLVVLFGLAVLLTIVAVYVVAVVALKGHAIYTSGPGDPSVSWWSTKAFMLSTIGTLVLVGGGTIYKIRELARGGGSLVCEQLGGRFVDFRTDNLAEQQLINIVEEMSIASGVSVPLLYVLDNESGINAFAAGFTPNNAAVAVSRGCLELLNRDELQGVIAHEFSHILNGDMRINIRMIGILHGILMLALAGRVMMRAAFYSGGGRSRSSKNSGSGLLYLVGAGAALFVIGYVGRLFGQMIKSAVSRQREYLADASAVQFTRNPKGLAGALQKIGGYTNGSRINSPNAEEISHLFFGNALSGSSWLNSVFATHPPLKKRIRRVDPSFHGAFPKVEVPKQLERAPDDGKPRWDLDLQGRAGAHAGAAGLAGASALAADGGSPAGSRRANPPARASSERVHLDADQVAGSAGQTSEEHVEYARGAIAAIPETIRQAARDTYSAAAVVFALLIDIDVQTRQKQLEMLGCDLTAAMAEETHRYMRLLEDFDAQYRLPLVELLVPALRQMSEQHHAHFVSILDKLIMADDEVTLFEFSLEKLLKHRLEARHGNTGGRRIAQYYSMTPLRHDVGRLLSSLAFAGHDDVAGAQAAFRNGASQLKNAGVRNKLELMSRSALSFDELDASLDRIAHATNGIKQQVVNATAHCVLDDEEVTAGEAELLRVVCEVIDVPLPPFLPDLSE